MGDFHQKNANNNGNYNRNNFQRGTGKQQPRVNNGHTDKRNSNHHYVKVNKKQIKAMSDDELREKLQSLIRKCISSEKMSSLLKFLQCNNNSQRCNKYWGAQTNQVFINRKASEIEIYIGFLCKLFEAKCIHNKRDEFVRENVSFLAEAMDDSSSDCPQFSTYIGQMMARLFVHQSIPIDSTLNLFHKVYYSQTDEYAESADVKKKRFSKIVLSFLNCLNKSKAQNVLKNISKSIHMNDKEIDEGVFKNDFLVLFEQYIQKLTSLLSFCFVFGFSLLDNIFIHALFFIVLLTITTVRPSNYFSIFFWLVVA